MSHLRRKYASGVDKRYVVFFHLSRSGVPSTLAGLKGNPVRLAIRVGEPIPELPPQLFAASPCLKLPLGLQEPGKAEQRL